MGTDYYEQITGQKTISDFDIDHIIINYVDDSTNIISNDNKCKNIKDNMGFYQFILLSSLIKTCTNVDNV